MILIKEFTKKYIPTKLHKTQIAKNTVTECSHQEFK